MAITVKGPSAPALPQAIGTERNAAADAYARLSKKGGAKGKQAADLVGGLLDEVVEDDADLGPELEAARQMIDGATDDMPEGTAMERAEAVAERLKKKLEATRGQRHPLSQKIKKAFDKLDE